MCRIVDLKKSVLFSLDCVLERENSGFLVPDLVRRSILEIEKRGLDIIGKIIFFGSSWLTQFSNSYHTQ